MSFNFLSVLAGTEVPNFASLHLPTKLHQYAFVSAPKYHFTQALHWQRTMFNEISAARVTPHCRMKHVPSGRQLPNSHTRMGDSD